MRWVFAIHRWAHKATLWVLTQPIFHLPLFFTSFIISLFYSNNRSAPNIAILCLFIWYFKESIIRLYQCYICTCIYNVIYMCTLSLAPSIFPLIWFFGDKIDTVFFSFGIRCCRFSYGLWIYDVEGWKKSDGFPMIFICDLATSYFWQHHLQTFVF